ncbi:MAG: right-handed parallel beta-helix repeat-containing protein [Candidatus Thermoplasmatota archaeon]|nr:right-handed parallel beta-helix repeat-containing protein [Candidatus Thermoplasmatota archaeon]
MNRSSLLRLLSGIALLVVLFAPLSAVSTVHAVQPIYQETIIVDQSGTGDYTTIKSAIAAAAPLSIIKIRAGTYEEHDFTIAKKIALVGESPETTIIDLEGNDGFLLKSTHIELHNLKITNSDQYAISIPSDNDYCNVSSCVIEHARVYGIVLQASYCRLYNIKIQGDQSSAEGITVRGRGSIINRCSIQGFRNGILTLLGAKDNQILYTNIFNNDVGFDFRISASDNMVSQCNIYGNEYGIHIWQNSHRNQVYLNNFWKNDEDVIDEGNNSWDNGEQGNYWDQYTGKDVNGDGIGDTPYTISSTTKDSYPLMDMILPTAITVPPNIKLASSTWEDTPSFSWDQAIYSKGVEGYYVKIGNDPELSVGKATSWTSPTPVSNGVHTFYIRAEGTDGTSSEYGTLTFSIDTTFVDTDGDGWSDDEEQQYGTDPNDSDNYPLDTDGDHVPDSVDTDDDNDGYSDDMELSYGTDPKNPNSYPLDTDGDGVPDRDSIDGKYEGDIDDDDDGLIDTVEINLGSNPKDPTDVVKIFVSGTAYYLVDISASGVYDVLYNPSTGATTAVERYGDKYYRLDINGDNAWDYIYQPSDGSIVTYTGEQPDLITIDTILIILSLALTIFLIFFYLFKIRPQRYEPFRKPLKIKKHPIHRKPLDYQPTDAKDTVEMIGRTRVLLQHIHEDVQVYMDQLSQMQEQLTMTTMKPEETPEEPTTVPEPAPEASDVALAPTEQVPEKPTKETDVDSEVDQLLSRLEKKEKT